MRTLESALLDQLEQAGKVGWDLYDQHGKVMSRDFGRAWGARCVVVSSGALLIELRKHGSAFQARGSDVLTGKDLRQVPEVIELREVEIPVYYLRELGA